MEKKDNEQIKAEINRLYKLYYERDKEYETAKGKRCLLTLAGFAVVFFGILCAVLEPQGWDILFMLFLAIIWSGVHFFVNVSVFGALSDKGRDEGDYLRNLKKRIAELEKELDS